jgi:hypothetical protein
MGRLPANRPRFRAPLLPQQPLDGREVSSILRLAPRAAPTRTRHLHCHRGTVSHHRRAWRCAPRPGRSCLGSACERERDRRYGEAPLPQRPNLISFPRGKSPIDHRLGKSHLLPESKCSGRESVQRC